MDEGVEYYDDDLRAKLSLESNIMTDHILAEQIQRALSDGIILETRSALNGKKIYMLRETCRQTELNFLADVEPVET